MAQALAQMMAPYFGVNPQANNASQAPIGDDDNEDLSNDPTAPENDRPIGDDDDEPTQDDDDEPTQDDDDEPTQDDDDEPTQDDDDEPTQDDDDEPTQDDDEPAYDDALSDEDIAAILTKAGVEANADTILGAKVALSAQQAASVAPVGDSKRAKRRTIIRTTKRARRLAIGDSKLAKRRTASLSQATVLRYINNEVSKYRKQDSDKYNAAREVRNVLGNIDALAYDSAGDIYRNALLKLGYSRVETGRLSASEARASFRAMSKSLSSKRAMTKDSRTVKSAADQSLELLLRRMN